MRLAIQAAMALLIPSLPAFTQTTVSSVEPDNSKATANPAPGLVTGDRIEVDSFQTGSLPVDSLNFFRVGTAPAAPGIYRHRLEEEGAISHLYGADSLPDNVLPNSIAELQSNEGLGGLTPLTWYGFGQAEEVFVGLTPTVFFRQACRATLTTEPVVPVDLGTIPTSLLGSPQQINIRSFAQTVPLNRDLEIHLFDGSMRAIPGHWSDRPSFFGDPQGEMVVSLQEGRYYVALTDIDLVSDQPASTRLNFNVDLVHDVFDFPGAVASKSREVGFEARVRVRNLSGFNEVGTWVKTEPFEVAWFTFRVGETQSSFVFCDGDQVPEPCPCGNDPGAGTLTGCVNSTGRGARSIAWRTSPFFVNTDTVISFSDLPASTTVLPFVSTGTGGTQTFFGGNVCLDPAGTVRLLPIFANEAGDAETVLAEGSVPAGFEGQTIYVQGAYRDIGGASGCEVNFTSGSAYRFDL